MGGVHVMPLSPLSNGWLGVNAFFILSGVVLYLPYARGTRRFARVGDVIPFYRRRAARLLPLYYIVLLVLYLFHPAVNRLTWTRGFWEQLSVMGSLTWVLSPRFMFPQFNVPLWSLGVEIWFSVLFPLLAVAMKRWGPGRVALAVFPLCVAVRFINLDPTYLTWARDGVVGRLDDCVTGMLIAHALVHGLLPRGRGGRALLCLAGMVALLLACWGWDWEMQGFARRYWIPLLNNAVQLGMGCIVLGVSASRAGLLRSFLAWAPLQVLGMMCYSIYIWHFPALSFFFGSVAPRTVQPLTVVVFGIMLLVTSALSYRYIEFGRVTDWRALFRAARDDAKKDA